MSALLSIGEAARRLRLSVDTVRELERTGELRASRTRGGHRRFSMATLDAFAARQLRSGEPHTDEYTESTSDDSWDDENAPRAVVARPLDTARPTTRSPAVDPLVEVAAQYVERTRLDGLKAHGRFKIPFGASAQARSAAIEALDTYVTAVRFPASMQWWEAHPAIEAKVAAVLEAFALEAARSTAPSLIVATPRADRAQDDRRVQALIAHGKMRALFATINWVRDDAEEARADVLEALRDEVESDWTESEVNELVDEILDEWQEEREE